jgi:hypothetical protein
MTAPKLPEGLEAIRALCAGRVEWRVARDDGAYCMSFNRDDSLNPEQEANEWLARHLFDYPERFLGYKVQRVVVQSQLQEEALALIVRLSDAQAALQALAAEHATEIRRIRDIRNENAEDYRAEIRLCREEIAALKEDAARLDYLQSWGATVEILPDGSWRQFRIGGRHSAKSPSIRAAIDSALLAAKEAK